jgi:hypothetical protein
MKKEKGITSVFFVKDETGKIWKETCGTDERSVKLYFVRDWLSRCKTIDSYDAEQVWRLFEKSGWEIIELEIQTSEQQDNGN